jgi:hypothetical protein
LQKVLRGGDLLGYYLEPCGKVFLGAALPMFEEALSRSVQDSQRRRVG